MLHFISSPSHWKFKLKTSSQQLWVFHFNRKTNKLTPRKGDWGVTEVQKPCHREEDQGNQTENVDRARTISLCAPKEGERTNLKERKRQVSYQRKNFLTANGVQQWNQLPDYTAITQGPNLGFSAIKASGPHPRHG